MLNGSRASGLFVLALAALLAAAMPAACADRCERLLNRLDNHLDDANAAQHFYRLHCRRLIGLPGVQFNARISDDPEDQARILILLPDQWNGKLVVAGASGTRSEFNGDFAWSDFVLQKGYAYVSQNKGVLNLFLTTSADPLGCCLNPTS